MSIFVSPGIQIVYDMEIISIEKRVFDSMLSRMETVADKVEALCDGVNGKSLKKWLDGEDVCRLLNINKRTLQSYRDKKIIPYSQFVHKIYYKVEDVERLLESSLQNKEKPYEK